MSGVLGRAWRGIRQSPGLFATTTLSVAVSLLLVGAFAVALDAARAWLETVVGAETLIVYLRPELDERGAREVAAELGSRAEVATVTLESPDASAERLRAVLEEEAQAAVTGALGWSLQVRAREAGQLQALATALAAIPGVDEVDYGEGLYERLQAIERVVSLGSGALLALVLAVCAYVVSITVSLALYVRREEIQVQKIVGASDAFVVAPLLVEGALSGLGGALLSSATLAALTFWARSRFSSAFSSLGFSAEGGLPTGLAAAQVALGVVICTIGALFAGVRYLRQTE